MNREDIGVNDKIEEMKKFYNEQVNAEFRNAHTKLQAEKFKVEFLDEKITSY